MFSTSEFQAWGKANAVLFAAVMTKIEGREHDALLRTYGFRGFPSMALLDAQGEVITKKIPRDLFAMQKIVKAATAHRELEAKIEAGEDVDKAAWFLARLGMGELDLSAAKTELADLTLDGEQRESVEQQLLVMEVDGLMRKMRGRGVRQEDRDAVAAEIHEMFTAGKRLPVTASQIAFFDDMLIKAAKKAGDAKAFLYSFPRVRESIVKGIERTESYLPRYERDLEKFADDARMRPRVEAAIRRAKSSIAQARKRLDELDAQAEKFRRADR